MTLDRACTAHGPPSESAHCFNLGTRGKEEQRETLRDTEENCGGRKAKDGFLSRMEETSQWPYSPRGELGISSNTERVYLKHLGRPSSH